MNRRGIAFVEFIVALSISVVLFFSVAGITVIAKNIVAKELISCNLQRDVERVMAEIVRGKKEGGVSYGLRSAVSFTRPSVTPSNSEIDFVGSDSNTRRVFLSSNSIQYVSPTQSPQQRTIYSAPSSGSVTLRFTEPSGLSDHQTVTIYIAVSQTVSGKTYTGSLTSNVNLMNVEK